VDSQDHESLALWAADCAEHVLPYFEEKCPKDARPRRAIEAARAWARGEIRVGEARAAAVATHAAAYAAKAVTYASESASAFAEEREWQYQRLPEHLRPVAFPARGLRPLSCPSIHPRCTSQNIKHLELRFRALMTESDVLRIGLARV
jgi:hypothetical protein